VTVRVNGTAATGTFPLQVVTAALPDGASNPEEIRREQTSLGMFGSLCRFRHSNHRKTELANFGKASPYRTARSTSILKPS
jgi:hypothetical protein